MAKNMYMVENIKVVEEYNGVELVSITIDDMFTVEVSKNENETVNKIIEYILNNFEELITNYIDVSDVIEKPMAHPHYHSRTDNTVYYDTERGIVYDCGCSGSPSAWNHYLTEIFSLSDLGEWIYNDILCVADVIDDDDYQVSVNRDLWNIYVDNLTAMGGEYPYKEELYL